MFGQKSLTDVVKGIRATKRDTALYISACIAEIKNEIMSTDPQLKATALEKLTFLQMMGYDMSFASFSASIGCIHAAAALFARAHNKECRARLELEMHQDPDLALKV